MATHSHHSCSFLLGWKAIFGCLLSLLSIVSYSSAQILPFHFYTVKDGLCSNSVNSIFQDSRGFLWIGTNDGLSMFDGRSFRNYTTYDGLCHNFVNDIIEDRTDPGTLWIATSGGVSRLKGGTFTTFTLGSRPWAQIVHCLLQDHSGIIWCGTDSCVIRIFHDTVMSELLTPINIQNVGNIAETGDSLIWFAHSSGLTSLHERTHEFKNLPENDSAQVTVGAMTADQEGTLWIVQTDGTILKVRDHKIVGRVRSACGGPTFVESDRHGRLWFGSYGGLFRLEKNKFDSGFIMQFGTENGLAEDRLRAGTVDRENNLWIGGTGKGIVKLVSTTICDIPLTERSTAGPLNHFAAADRANHLWLSWYDEVWEVWEDSTGSWQKIRHTADLGTSFDHPLAVGISPEGILCVSFVHAGLRCFRVTHHGRRHSDLHLVRSLRPGLELPQGTSLTFMVDHHGRIWYSIGGVGVVLIDPERTDPLVRIFGQREGVPVNYVTVIHEDAQGNIWCGSYAEGLFKLDATDLPHGDFHRYAAGIRDDRIRAVAEDHRGHLWVGTRAGGITVISMEGYRTYSMRDGLFSNTVQSFHEDSLGRMWIGMPSGLQYFDVDSDATPGRSPFRQNSDLIGNSVISSGTMSNGINWYATLDGVTVFDLPAEAADQIPPPVYVQRVRVGDRDLVPPVAVELRYDENNCTFDFIGISFQDEKAIRYRYRLVGADRNWQPPTAQTSVTYAFLRPGMYTFEVKAINGAGIESTAPASFPFTISAPYWERWWFYVLVSLAAGGVLVTLYRYRVRKLLELERMRIRIASDLHDDVGSTLTKISLQSDLLQRKLVTDDMKSSVLKIGTMSREVVSTMGDLVWSIDARNDTVGDLIDRMRDFASSTLSTRDITVEFIVQGLEGTQRLSVDVRQSIYLIFKEAVTNIARHAEATAVKVVLLNDAKQFLMKIVNDGKGKSGIAKLTGHGLKNMQMRAEHIGGRFEAKDEDGFTITLRTKPL